MRITFKCTGVITTFNGSFYFLAKPDKDHKLGQIPIGVNPRDVDEQSNIGKDIRLSFEKNDNTFNVKNGGLQVIVDENSLEHDEEAGYVSFTCTNPDTGIIEDTTKVKKGTYDGGHTTDNVDKSIDEMHEEDPSIEFNNYVLIAAHYESVFPTVGEARGAAEAINKRSSQKISSEANITGRFDFIKDKLFYTSGQNIGWRQHQKNENGDKIRPECEVQQVIRVLACLLPLAEVRDLGVSKIAGLPKGAEKAAINLLNDDTMPYMESASKHIDFLLEISDYIQNSMPQILGEYYEELVMIKKTSAGQLKKPPSKRDFYEQGDFKGNKVSGALNKDIILMFIYAIAKNCFDYDSARGEFLERQNINFAKGLWDSHGKELLVHVNCRYEKNCLRVTEPLRVSDFVKDETLYNSLAEKLQRHIIDQMMAKAA